MKKRFKIFVIGCMAVTLLAGCGGKKPAASRVEEKNFAFTAEEFKNYFNDEAGMGNKIEDFKGSKMEKLDKYMYSGHLDDCAIYAYSDTENGKLTEVSIKFYGGKESTKGVMSEIKLSKGEVNTLKKNASVVFDVCEPNVETKKFEEFFRKNLEDATMLADTSEEIGDLNVSLDTKTGIEFDFKSKTQE